MEDCKEYTLRKEREYAGLKKVINDSDTQPCNTTKHSKSKIGSQANALSIKSQIREQLLLHYARLSSRLQQSNLNYHDDIHMYKGVFSYTYQRFNLKLKNWNVLANFYGISNQDELATYSYFVGSGMGAISSVFLTLDMLVPSDTKLVMHISSYFETVAFCRKYLRNLKLSTSWKEEEITKAEILYLDSISHEDTLKSILKIPPKNFKNLFCIILDTTCLSDNSPEIEAIVEYCTRSKIPLILVRSHLKLDYLALELGRLGSIAVVCPKWCGLYKTKLIRELKYSLFDLIGKFGLMFDPAALLPLFWDDQLKTLNRKRLEILKNNNNAVAIRIEEKLKNHSNIKIKKYPHGMFFTIGLKNGGKEQVEIQLKVLLETLNDNGVIAKRVASFGFDFVALETYIDLAEQITVLRVSLPDFSRRDVDLFQKTLLEWVDKSLEAA